MGTFYRCLGEISRELGHQSLHAFDVAGVLGEAGSSRRDEVGHAEVVAGEEEWFVGEAGDGVGEAVAQVEAGLMSTPAEATEGSKGLAPVRRAAGVVGVAVGEEEIPDAVRVDAVAGEYRESPFGAPAGARVEHEPVLAGRDEMVLTLELGDETVTRRFSAAQAPVVCPELR